MRQLALEAGRKVATQAREERGLAKVEVGRRMIEAEVREADARRAAILATEVRVRSDVRAARLIVLRRQGLSMVQAFETVEREFADK